jgi:hypothetical protein
MKQHYLPGMEVGHYFIRRKIVRGLVVDVPVRVCEAPEEGGVPHLLHQRKGLVGELSFRKPEITLIIEIVPQVVLHPFGVFIESQVTARCSRSYGCRVVAYIWSFVHHTPNKIGLLLT